MERRVRDLMTDPVPVIDKAGRLEDAERILLDPQADGLPVVDEAERIVGLVSRGDLLAWRAAAAHVGGKGAEKPALTATVGDVMSPVVHCILGDRPIVEAAARMVRERVPRLIVVDGEYRVLGRIAATDLLRELPGVDEILDRERLTGT